MDKIKTYKQQSIRYLISFYLMVILLLYTFYSTNKIKPVEQQIVPALLIAFCLMMYINYVNLKTKAEILKELEKANRNEDQGKP